MENDLKAMNRFFPVIFVSVIFIFFFLLIKPHIDKVIIYRFKTEEDRAPVSFIIDETFPQLLNIFQRLVQIPNPSIEVADLMKLICKIFWSSIYVCSYSVNLIIHLSCYNCTQTSKINCPLV